ncbi:sterol carrier protein 2-like [Tubulanus polymorphus]|uniref:sterol carrier protein 2-like n=1 Tax=Tubulanus polymorphus TaxID=672921 RepID=UPI003DA1E8EB
MSASRSFVTGVGMTKFVKPQSKNWDYPQIGKEACEAALRDSKIPYSSIQAVVASYCYGEPTCGQRVVYELGLTGIPVFNVNNNCSSASTALMLANLLVKSGYDCVLAVGFEKMEGGLSQRYPEKESPVGRHVNHLTKLGAERGLVKPKLNKMTSDVIKMFAYAAREYEDRYKTYFTDWVEIAFKNRQHGKNNPYASVRKDVTRKTIADESKTLCHPITLGMSTPTADGGAAAVVCSEAFVRRRKLQNKAVEIIAQHMVTDLPSSFGDKFKDVVGYSMAKEAAEKCYTDTGLSARHLDILEVHDCFSCNELFMYEALQLAEEGKGTELLHSGEWITNKAGGKLYKMDRWVVNPSGGLISKGHPIGATGLGQCAELVWQLRGEAGKRQVDGAKIGMQHNFGIGGAAVVTMYAKPDFDQVISSKL